MSDTPDVLEKKRGILAAIADLFGLGSPPAGDTAAAGEPAASNQASADPPPPPEAAPAASHAEQQGEGQADEPTAKETQQAAADRGNLSRFLDAFGDVGGRWYAEGLNFEAAQTRRIAQLEEDLAQAQKQLEAVGKLRGEEEPAQFDEADADDGTGPSSTERFRLGDRRARMAHLIRQQRTRAAQAN